ncbi:type 4a pilus biogenesis protein PilO [Vreelandella aquamarina]|uniref:Pilus assembly protein PilO n=1 Tax=Vreelandella aquamarina TaxID=77097 RepID=A0A857GHX2_9GAMM|nr:type 4a pilus biogenesis protein PilO [Halomonas meridiana]QHD48858.1 pilus assembly protein PilO [Halomonas meridiana]
MKWGRERWQDEWQRLKTLDWQALDVKEAGEWPVLLKALCGALAFGVALGGLSWWLVSEKRVELEAAERQEARLLNEYRSKVSEAAFLPEVRDQLTALEEQMATMRSMLPTSAEIPSLLDSISDAALDNDLSIETIRLRPTVSNTHYVEHPLDIQVRGGYHELAQFVADISQLARIVTQHDVALSPAEQSGESLRMSLVARTYSYIEEAGEGEVPAP